MKTFSAPRFAIFLSIVALGSGIDLLTKHWIFARLGMPNPHDPQSIWLLDEVFGFTTSLNEGALFGLGQGQVVLFAVLSIVAAIGILYWLFVAGGAADLLLTLALACVTAGIFGNLYDRLGLPGLRWQADMIHADGQPVYAVRDWLHFKVEGLIDWPIFNIADSLLVCGAVLLVWHAFRAESARAAAVQQASPPAAT